MSFDFLAKATLELAKIFVLPKVAHFHLLLKAQLGEVDAYFRYDSVTRFLALRIEESYILVLTTRNVSHPHNEVILTRELAVVGALLVDL